eukprot:Gb_01060 [translate_table: standard]
MDGEVEPYENGSKNHKQLAANFDIMSTSSEVLPETSKMNETLKSQTDRELKDFNNSEGCTERSELLENQRGQTYRPLTLLRVIRGALCLVVLVSTAFMTLIFLAPVTFLILRLFSIHYSREATSFLFGHWLAMWPFLFEKINKTKVVFAGDSVPPRERILLFSNHRTEVDWMYIWDLALRKDRLGYVKYMLKSSVRNVPIFGWGFHVLEFILVERKWEMDKPVIELMLSTFNDPQDPLWLVLFPEGTDFTEQKCIRSQRFAEEHGLPILNNVLLPRTKGFFSCLSLLRGSLDAVYDVTIGYNYQCPLFMDNVFGVDPAEVHIHVRRVSIMEIPTSEDGAAAWLIESFRQKDKLLSSFYTKGRFPNSVIEDDIPTFKCLVNFAVMVIATAFFLTFTILSSMWLKIYVALSCVYFAAATYFNCRPKPILECMKGRIPFGNTRISSSLQDSY